MTKKTIRRSKKAVKPELLINTVGCNTITDIQNNYIEEKVRAGKTITIDELNVIRNAVKPNIEFVVLPCFRCVKDENNVVEENNPVEKKPWYKKFWNWVCRK